MIITDYNTDVFNFKKHIQELYNFIKDQIFIIHQGFIDFAKKNHFI
jgi:hypothetical protein